MSVRTFIFIFLVFPFTCIWGAGLISTNDAFYELNYNGNVRFVDTRDVKSYQSGHIADAVVIINSDLTETVNGVPGMAKPPQEIVNIFRENGIDRENRVIVYANGSSPNDYMYASRIIALLNYVKINDTYLMDGGFTKWVSENKGYEAGPEMASPSNLVYNGYDSNILVDLAYIEQNLYNDYVVFIDTRNINYFIGVDKDIRLYRHGHIPGAINIDASSLTKKINNYYVIISEQELADIIYETGYEDYQDIFEKTLITYCNTGVQASGGWFVFKYVYNHQDVSIYEGSMSEYSRSSLPLE
ncbi:MAG: rhodanese-like domain-containing protein [Deferribacterota bacterium]|nr:rhodanese-like domain-containing protein [Deferribacterota bacterium]